MKDDKKQIEDIALLLQSYSDISQSYYSGEWHSNDVYYGLAKSLYYNNLRIVSKDSVVLTNDNAEELANLIVTSPQMQSVMNDLIKAWQKETAEKYNDKLVAIIQHLFDIGQIDFKAKIEFLKKNEKILKQFGVDIKE